MQNIILRPRYRDLDIILQCISLRVISAVQNTFRLYSRDRPIYRFTDIFPDIYHNRISVLKNFTQLFMYFITVNKYRFCISVIGYINMQIIGIDISYKKSITVDH